MVSRILPGWSWEEDFDDRQWAHLAGRIVAELDARLDPGPGRRVYAVAGHPRVPRDLQAALDGMARDGHDLRRVPRERRSDAYVTADPAVFRRVLPVFFVLGPPEVTVMAVAEDAVAAHGGLGGLVTAASTRPGGVPGCAVCMDFDSGDLFRIT